MPGPVTEQQRRAAALVCAANARGADDLRQLLAQVGLADLPTEPVEQDPDHNMRAYRQGCRCTTCRAANARTQHNKTHTRPR